jgi:hypothetical protein
MKSIKTIAVLSVLGLSLLGVRALGQTDPGTGQGAVWIIEKGPPSTSLGQTDPGTGQADQPTPPADRPERPRLGERPKLQLPEDLKAMIEAYRQAVTDFRAKQAELIKQLRDATTEERAALKEQLKENREAFREAQKELQQDILARLQELRAQFKNQRDQLIEAAKEQGKKRRGR